MKAILIWILFAYAAALAGPAAAQPLLQQGVPFPPAGAPQPGYTVSEAVITSLEVPPVGSGIIHVYVVAQVRAPGPIRYEMRWSYYGAGQFIPPVGSVCTFTFHYEATHFDGEPRLPAVGQRLNIDYNRPSLVVDDYECDSGRDPLFGPRPPAPSADASWPYARGALRRVVAFPAHALAILAEQPLPPAQAASGDLRFRLFTVAAPVGCLGAHCPHRIFYLVAWRDGGPGWAVLESPLAAFWRDLRIEGVAEEGGRVTIRVSGERDARGGGAERTEFSTVVELN
jgi:hypothetical protein